MKRTIILILVLSLSAMGGILLFVSCGGGNGGGGDSGPAWTWLGGESTGDQVGSYGVQGAPAASNWPGSRQSAAWIVDSSGTLWMFGGFGYGSTTGTGYLNDLWSFDGTVWTWESGSGDISITGVYDVMGSPSSTNMPGSRSGAAAWVDTTGNLWFFGGIGFAQSDFFAGYMNDMWKYDGTDWTWVLGDSKDGWEPASYHQLAAYSATNLPGFRIDSAQWTDGDGEMWLFGGQGADENDDQGRLNDLWKFNGSQWAWMGGSTTRNASGDYGTQGVFDASNTPGARRNAVWWTDVDGDLWIFGGNGYGAGTTLGYVTDFWQYDTDIEQWAWMAGPTTVNQMGSYGTRGNADPANWPGARYGSQFWIDDSGSLWIQGGFGYAETGGLGFLNDLWKFDGTDWTWMAGSKTLNSNGVYGTTDSDAPGGRYKGVSGFKVNNSLYLFGGQGYDESSGGVVDLNDLWVYGE